MADFLTAYKITAKNEGGYANDSNDSGGRTIYGISYNNFPYWRGWPIVLQIIAKVGENAEAINQAAAANPQLQQVKLDFYKTNFWNPLRGDELIDQGEANKIYDMGVNAGVGTAIKLAYETENLPESIHMTDQLLNALNNKV